MRRYVIVFLLVVLVWILATCWMMGEFPSLERFGLVGEGLAPIGSGLTAVALMFAFQQNRDAADRALRDKLADAYAGWFKETRVIIKEMVTDAQDTRFKMQRNKSSQGYLEARARLFRLFPRLYELHVASTEVLLLEDREDLRTRIEALHANLSGPGLLLLRPQTIQNDTVHVHVTLMQRQKDLENLFSDVVVRLRSGVRPEPVEPPVSDEDQDAPDESAQGSD